MTTPHEVATFFVAGIPKAQPRPRAFAFKGADGKSRARVFDAGTAEEWKSRVALAAEPWRPAAPLELPIAITLTFCMPRPKDMLRPRAPDGFVPHTIKPDGDNLAKAVVDSMTATGWWRDDSQVYSWHVCKRYCDKTGAPGVIVSVSVLYDMNGGAADGAETP